MTIKIAVVEDDDKTAGAFTGYIKQFAEESGKHFTVDRFSDGDEIVGEYKPYYDIIFLDIEMKRFDGMSAAKEIRKLDNEVILIFVTNLAQYAVEGYSVNALDFILKPVSYPVLCELLRKLAGKLEAARKQYHILLPSKNGMKKVAASDIYYIECFSHKVTIYTRDEFFSVTGSLNKFEGELAGSSFIRCGRSHILNLAYVDSLTGRELAVGPYKIFVSRPQRKNVLDAIMSYHAKNMYDSGI